MNTVMVAAFRYRHQGEFAKATLESAGIPCVVVADDGGGMRPEIMGVNPVRVFVAAENAERAREILEEEEDEEEEDEE